MAAPITPVSANPFDSFSVSLPAATVVVLDPQPYNNTKEIILLNRSLTDAMLVQLTSLIVTPASARVESVSATPPEDRTAGGRGVAWGAGGQDQFMVGAGTLLATGGPRVAATDTFSVDVRAQALITVNAAGGLTVGDTIAFQYADATQPGGFGTQTLTAVAGPRVPGSLTFDVVAGAPAQAAAINTAINDSSLSTVGASQVATSTVAGNVVTVTAGSRRDIRGANGNSPARTVGSPNNFVLFGQFTAGITITATLSTAADLTVAGFIGGVNADGGFTESNPAMNPSGILIVNRKGDYDRNMAIGLNDAPGFAAIVSQAAYDTTAGDTVVQVLPLGAGGNGVALTENTGAARITVTTPTAGGVDAVPASIAAAGSTVIPASSAITISVGAEGNRHALGTDTYWASNAGSGLGIVAQMEAGGPADLNVTYVNNRGYAEGV
jgi:hypothetical protein